MRQKIKPWLDSFGTWCSANRRTLTIVLGTIVLGLIIMLAFHKLPAWEVWLYIWATAVITPILLGMMGKTIGFRWVVLWECILFLPVVLILAFFVQDIRNYITRSTAR